MSLPDIGRRLALVWQLDILWISCAPSTENVLAVLQEAVDAATARDQQGQGGKNERESASSVMAIIAVSPVSPISPVSSPSIFATTSFSGVRVERLESATFFEIGGLHFIDHVTQAVHLHTIPTVAKEEAKSSDSVLATGFPSVTESALNSGVFPDLD